MPQAFAARSLAEDIRLRRAVRQLSRVGIPADKFAAMPEEMKNRELTKFASPDNIHIVVAGSDAGKFSGAFHGWLTGPGGSIVVSRKIEEV